MHTKVFSVYDTKAACFGTPFFAVSKGVAIRMFTELANDKRSSVSKYPTDFTLWEIGEFEDIKGTLIPLEHNVNLGFAQEFVRVEPTPLLPGMKETFEGERKIEEVK